MGIVYVLAGMPCLIAAIWTESRLHGILFGFAGALLDSLPIFLLEYTGESPLSPFYPPDLDSRVDSPALSGRGSRPSGRTSG